MTCSELAVNSFVSTIAYLIIQHIPDSDYPNDTAVEWRTNWKNHRRLRFWIERATSRWMFHTTFFFFFFFSNVRSNETTSIRALKNLARPLRRFQSKTEIPRTSNSPETDVWLNSETNPRIERVCSEKGKKTVTYAAIRAHSLNRRARRSLRDTWSLHAVIHVIDLLHSRSFDSKINVTKGNRELGEWRRRSD